MSNNIRTQLAKAFLAELKTRFIIFHTHFPLEIGIDKELESLFPQVPKPVIKEAIRRVVHTVTYQQNLIRYEDRLNLRGEPAGKITRREQQNAHNFLWKYQSRLPMTS